MSKNAFGACHGNATGGAVAHPASFAAVCTRGWFITSVNDVYCKIPGYLTNIIPGKQVNRNIWAENFDSTSQVKLSFSINATYHGRAYAQPVFQFTGPNNKNFFVNPQFFDSIALPCNPIIGDNIYTDNGCINGCTGYRLFNPWFGNRSQGDVCFNPERYMSTGATPCEAGDPFADGHCILNNASLSITRLQFQRILNKLVLLGDIDQSSANPHDWALNNYHFNVELPSDPAINSYVDMNISSVTLTTDSQPRPSVTISIDDRADGSATMAHTGAFRLKMVSQNASACAVERFLEEVSQFNECPGHPGDPAPCGIVNYDWGVISGWGGPANYKWVATCYGFNQSASSVARLKILPAGTIGPQVGVHRPSNSHFYLDYDFDHVANLDRAFGNPNDIGLTADMNGDGYADLVLYRQGTWFVDTNKNGTVENIYNFGAPSDIPLLGDFNGDRQQDLVVYRGGTWYVSLSPARDATADLVYAFGGVPGDKPLTCDLNADGVSDLVIYRNGWWYIDTNRDGVADMVIAFGGVPSDIPYCADVSDDGRADLVLFRDCTSSVNLRQSGLPSA